MIKYKIFHQKNVLVTGAAGGLGRELCLEFGRHGATIIALDIQSESLALLTDLLSDQGIKCSTYVCDITDIEQCKTVIEKIDSEYSSIDYVVHNAGLSHRSTFINTKIDVLKKVLDVNINGVIHLTHCTLPQIIENKGTYVVISSVAGFAPLMGRTGYTASKHALHGFFESLRTEVIEKGVNVLMVCPSFMKTSLEHTAFGKDGEKVSQKRETIGNLLTPEYVAKKIVKGIVTNKKRLNIGGVSKVAFWVHRFAPKWYSWIMKKKVAKEFEYEVSDNHTQIRNADLK